MKNTRKNFFLNTKIRYLLFNDNPKNEEKIYSSLKEINPLKTEEEIKEFMSNLKKNNWKIKFADEN